MDPLSVNLMALVAIVALYYTFIRKKPEAAQKFEMKQPSRAKAA